MSSRLAGVLVAVVSVVACAAPVAGQRAESPVVAVFPGEVRVRLEVADTEPLRQRGLMYRRALAADDGMIFVFDEPGFYPFWMKNTLVPLDIFWVAADGTIVSIQQDVPPCGNTSPLDMDCPTWPPRAGTTATYVIETQAGFARRHGLREGQRVRVSGLPGR